MKRGKIFKIESKSDTSHYIRFRLNSIINYGGYGSPFISCTKSHPFNDWKVGDYLEIDLDRISSEAIYDTSIVRILDANAIDEMKKSQMELYELKKFEEGLIPVLNNFSQKMARKVFFDSDFDEFVFDELALPVWKEKLDDMTNEFDKLKRKNEASAERCRNLTDELRKYEDYKEKFEEVRNRNEADKVSNTRTNTRLEEKLESSNAQNIDLKKRLEDSEKKVLLLENKLDDANNQLTVLRLESGKKDDEIKNLKNQAKSSSKQAEKSHKDLSNEKLRSEKENLKLLANELKINLEKIDNLSRHHERLFRARKTNNQDNIETHEKNIAQIEEEFSSKVNIVHVQEICRKCQRVAELSWELEELEKTQPRQIQMSDWKNINPNFTPELTQEWINRGFTHEQCRDWMNTALSWQQNRAIKEPAYYAWLRDVKKVDAEWVLNNGNEKELGQEFFKWYQEQQQTQAQIEQPVK